MVAILLLMRVLVLGSDVMFAVVWMMLLLMLLLMSIASIG